MSAGWWVALILGGCAHKAPPPPGESLGLASDPVERNSRPEVRGPIRWWDGTGLCLEVPPGWSGLGRDPEGPLLTLVAEDTGVQVEIFRAEAPGDRRDLIQVFEDEGSFRDLPALGLAGVETWISERPAGPTLQVWTAVVQGTPIRVEARYPHGGSFAGKRQVEALLAALCVE